MVGVIFIFIARGQYFYDESAVSSQFGADFYTEIHEVAVGIYRVVGRTGSKVYELLGTCFGVFMIFAGMVDICVFKILGDKHSKEREQDAAAELPGEEEIAG